MRSFMLVLLTMLVACGGGTGPTPLGRLDSKITRGERQATRAGNWRADSVVDLVYRNPLTGAMMDHKPALWERLILPPLAYALQATNIIVQPNSVVCQKQPYGQLVAEVPCVNSDAFGNSKFSFVETHVAGTHMAQITATYGLETTAPDTVIIVVEPGAADPNYRTPSLPMIVSGGVVPDIAVVDAYGNAVPYRIVGDKYISVADKEVGSEGARTITFSQAVETEQVTELRGKDELLVGWFGYTIGGSPLKATWRAVGTNIQIP